MKIEALPTPVGLKARRRFETGRLAADCQARAYEQLLPVAVPRENPVPHEPLKGERGECVRVTKKGVAA
jgi:hypothetical protein